MDDPSYNPTDDLIDDSTYDATYDDLTVDDVVVDGAGRGFRVADKQIDMVILEQEEGDGLVKLTPQEFDAANYQHRGEEDPPRG